MWPVESRISLIDVFFLKTQSPDHAEFGTIEERLYGILFGRKLLPFANQWDSKTIDHDHRLQKKLIVPGEVHVQRTKAA